VEHPRADRDGYVSRATLAAEANIGRRLVPNEVVHHVNRQRDDDRPENLRVMTNEEHAALHHSEDVRVPPRNQARGERQGHHVLTESQVREIRKAYPTKSYIELSCMFFIDRGAIRQIVLRRAWKHVA
jgi:hypothetical protein